MIRVLRIYFSSQWSLVFFATNDCNARSWIKKTIKKRKEKKRNFQESRYSSLSSFLDRSSSEFLRCSTLLNCAHARYLTLAAMQLTRGLIPKLQSGVVSAGSSRLVAIISNMCVPVQRLWYARMNARLLLILVRRRSSAADTLTLSRWCHFLVRYPSSLMERFRRDFELVLEFSTGHFSEFGRLFMIQWNSIYTYRFCLPFSWYF